VAARSGTVSARVAHWIERHPFSEPPASAGELLHTPQRISAFMTTVLLSAAGNILCGICNELALRHHNRAFGSPRIASTAYQSWPTKSHSIQPNKLIQKMFLRKKNQCFSFFRLFVSMYLPPARIDQIKIKKKQDKKEEEEEKKDTKESFFFLSL